MKKVILSLIVIAMSIAGSLTQAQNNTSGKKILVVYYSLSGNTEEIAKQIQTLTGGDIFRIETIQPYPDDYNRTTEVAKEEINMGSGRAIKEKVQNIKDYDIIFIGSPNWWSTIAPPVTTFLKEHDLAGKTVIPFITHGGGGKANCLNDAAKLCPKSTVPEGFVVSGNRVKSAKTDVEKWLKGIEVIK